jgi:[ribosomal protein S18]-alanine N-acetyltransferase
MKRLIRHATSRDFQTLVGIDAACFPPEIAYDPFELKEMMNQPGAKTIVLEEDGTIRAFLLMDVSRRRNTATLVTIDVLNEYRRQGHATELLSRSEQILEAQGIETYRLQVDTRNEAALAFYRKHGFKTERLIQNYYPGGRDAWEMVKQLSSNG